MSGRLLAEIGRLQKLLQDHGVESCEDLCLAVCMGPCEGRTSPTRAIDGPEAQK